MISYDVRRRIVLRLIAWYGLSPILIVLICQLVGHFFYNFVILYEKPSFWEAVLSIWPAYWRSGWILTIFYSVLLFPPLLLILLPKIELARRPLGEGSSGSRRDSQQAYFWTYKRFFGLYVAVSLAVSLWWNASTAVNRYMLAGDNREHVTIHGDLVPGPASGEPLLLTIFEFLMAIAPRTAIGWLLCFAAIQPFAIAGLFVLDRRNADHAAYEGTTPAAD